MNTLSTVTKKHVLASALAMGSLLMVAGCGQNGNNAVSNLVTNVVLSNWVKDGDSWVQLTASLNTGGFMLAGINVPIYDPKDTTKIYGQLSLLPNLCNAGSTCTGGGDLVVAVNTSQLSGSQAVFTDLPNGTPIPVGGLQNATLIGIPVGKTGARIYLAFGKGVAVFGTAIPFSALDPASKYTPGVNVFQPLTFGKVNLLAGLFIGSNTQPKTTGVALFADLSSVIGNITPAPASILATETQSSIDPSIVTMTPVSPGKAVEYSIYRQIYELSKKGLTLKIEE